MLANLASAWYNSVRFVRKGAFLAKIPGTRKERCNVSFPQQRLSPGGVIFFAFFTFAAMACAGTYSGGSGTAEDPYKISTVADWQELIATSADWNKNFILINDIDFEGAELSPIAPDYYPNLWSFDGISFTGKFEGDGHILRNAVINMPDQDYVGLFGNIANGGEIRNLGVIGFIVRGNDNVGGLVGGNGYADKGMIANCFVIGDVSGNRDVGGLCGINVGMIRGCNAAGEVTATVTGVGGLCGGNGFIGIINQCSSISAVQGEYNVGGLCGANQGTISECKATGEVTATVTGVGAVGIMAAME